MISRRDDHPVRVCPPTLALAGDQMHAGRPFTGCTLRPLTGGGSPHGMPPVRQWPGGTGSCHRPGRPAAITRHIALVMAALAICGHRRPAQRPYRYPGPSTRHPWPGSAGNPGMIPLAVPEIRRLLAAAFQRPNRPATPRTGWTGDAVTRPARTGSTSAPG